MKRLFRLFLFSLCLMLFTSSALALPENYVVRNGDRSVPKVAITVDDGWDLDMLRQIHALSVEMDFPITYFMVGSQFRPEDRELWEEIFAHGSELGNHTWKHSKLLSFSTSNANVQVRLCQERVDEVLGYHYPLRLLRPPYGQYKNSEKNYLNVFYSHGVEKVVLWDVSQTDPEKAFKDTQNGSILLYHTRKADLECLRVLVPMLKNAGYELVTVSDLLGMEPLVLERPESAESPADDAI